MDQNLKFIALNYILLYKVENYSQEKKKLVCYLFSASITLFSDPCYRYFTGHTHTHRIAYKSKYTYDKPNFYIHSLKSF